MGETEEILIKFNGQESCVNRREMWEKKAKDSPAFAITYMKKFQSLQYSTVFGRNTDDFTKSTLGIFLQKVIEIKYSKTLKQW